MLDSDSIPDADPDFEPYYVLVMLVEHHDPCPVCKIPLPEKWIEDVKWLEKCPKCGAIVGKFAAFPIALDQYKESTVNALVWEEKNQIPNPNPDNPPIDSQMYFSASIIPPSGGDLCILLDHRGIEPSDKSEMENPENDDKTTPFVAFRFYPETWFGGINLLSSLQGANSPLLEYTVTTVGKSSEIRVSGAYRAVGGKQWYIGNNIPVSDDYIQQYVDRINNDTSIPNSAELKDMETSSSGRQDPPESGPPSISYHAQPSYISCNNSTSDPIFVSGTPTITSRKARIESTIVGQIEYANPVYVVSTESSATYAYLHRGRYEAQNTLITTTYPNAKKLHVTVRVFLRIVNGKQDREHLGDARLVFYSVRLDTSLWSVDGIDMAALDAKEVESIEGSSLPMANDNPFYVDLDFDFEPLIYVDPKTGRGFTALVARAECGMNNKAEFMINISKLRLLGRDGDEVTMRTINEGI